MVVLKLDNQELSIYNVRSPKEERYRGTTSHKPNQDQDTIHHSLIQSLETWNLFNGHSKKSIQSN